MRHRTPQQLRATCVRLTAIEARRSAGCFAGTHTGRDWQRVQAATRVARAQLLAQRGQA
jgi:hypothetical protein